MSHGRCCAMVALRQASLAPLRKLAPFHQAATVGPSRGTLRHRNFCAGFEPPPPPRKAIQGFGVLVSLQMAASTNRECSNTNPGPSKAPTRGRVPS